MGCSRTTPTVYAAPLAPAPSRAGAFCLERKLRPGFGAQNGMRFPFEPLAESVSRNLAPEWDGLSGWSFKRKVHPGIRAWNGTHFPEQLSTGNCVPEFRFRVGHAFRNGSQAEAVSHSEHSIWDAVSARHAIWKAHPVLSAQSGTWFPRVLPTGKCVPVWWAGGHKFSSPYRSTSLSHVGSAVCRMPAVCSFLASIPAERTSFMVKRSRG